MGRFKHYTDADMVLGVLKVRLHLWAVSSMRERKSLVKRIINRIDQRFNASIGEVGDPEEVRQATIGISIVSTTEPHAHQVMEKIIEELDGCAEAETAETYREVIHI